MTARGKVRLAVDLLMTLALFFLMGYPFFGEVAHEWVGAAMFVLLIVHHVLNRRWYKNLFAGRYTATRILTLCLDVLVLLAMLAQMYSGIALSRHVFAFLPTGGGVLFARRLHLLSAYWGFLLMSAHLGLHWGMILTMLKKALHCKPSRVRKILSFLLGAAVAGYGVFALIRRNYLRYLFLQSEFVFLDPNESVALFYLDYLALMGLCIFLTHYGAKLTKRRKQDEKS